MEKHFDKIDIILISLISLCLLIIVVGLLWIILSKLEDKEVNKKKKTVTKDKNQLFIKEEEERLKKIFGTDISLQFSKQSQSGKICIHFSNLEEYQRIIDSFK